jgi:O-antigen/teichoic acid export membrane protein
MARVLDETGMGAVALLTVIFMALFQLTNLGFERYVVYSKDNSPDEFRASVDAVWTLQLLRGVVVLVVAGILALYFAGTSKFDLGAAHLAAIALAVVVLSLVNPELSGFERGGDFSFMARARGFAAILGAVATITVVLIWSTPWAYVIGQNVNAVTFAGLSFLYTERVPRISLSMERLARVFGYCKHLLVIAVVSFVSAQAQNVYVSAMFSPAVLGLYFTWFRLVNLPRELVTQLGTRILFAKASDEARHDENLSSSHLRGFAFTVVTLLPFHLFVWFHGDFLMRIVAGETWVSFWWGGQLMIVASLLLALSGTIGPYMLVHRPHVSSLLRSVEAAVTILLMIILGALFGLTGVLLSVVIVMAVAFVLRIVILFTQLVTIGRGQHARSLLIILFIVSAPLLLLEIFLTMITDSSMRSLVAILGYSAFTVVLFLVTMRRRGRLVGDIS